MSDIEHKTHPVPFWDAEGQQVEMEYPAGMRPEYVRRDDGKLLIIWVSIKTHNTSKEKS